MSDYTSLGAESIAFPLITTGVYGFPEAEALRIAIREISNFLMKEDTEMTIILVVFDERTFMLSKNKDFCRRQLFRSYTLGVMMRCRQNIRTAVLR